MSKFEGLGGTSIKSQNNLNYLSKQGSRSNKFEGLGGTLVQQNSTNTTPQQEDEGYLATIGKSAVTGISRLLDIPQAVGSLAEKGAKAYASKSAKNTELNPNIREKFQKYADTPEVISPLKPASQIARDFVAGEGNLDARPVGAGQRIISDIVDFGTSFATTLPFGGLGIGGRVVSGANTVKNTLGSLKTGAAIGATTGVLKEAGVDPLTADIGSSLAIPLGGRALSRVSGLSPNKINKQVYEAAKDLDIELPAAAVSRSKALDLIDSFVGKTPIAGDKLNKKYNLVGTRITEELEKIYDKIIPKAELIGVEDRIAKLYQKAESSIPLEGGIQPLNLNNKIADIEDKLAKGYFSSKSKDVSDVLDEIKQKETALKSLEKKASKIYDIGPKEGSVKPKNLNKGIKETEDKIGKGYFTSDEQKDVLNILDKIKTNMAEEVKSAPIKKLIATKKALNNQITWDKSEGYKNFLKGIQRSINEDIKAYSKTSAEAGDWYNFYKQADGLFGKVKTREALEHILSGKSTDYATETIKHSNLSKIIHDPKTRDEIKRLLGKSGEEGEKILDKIDKIGKVAKAITIKNRNVPNPSGSANVGAIAAIMGGMVYDPITTTGIIGGTTLATSLVTNQKFLDSAYKALVSKDKGALIRFGKEIEIITGASIVDLVKEFDRSQDRPVLSSEERKKKNELRKEERKKAVEKSRKDMDKWIEEERKNSLIDLFDFSSPSKQNKTK